MDENTLKVEAKWEGFPEETPETEERQRKPNLLYKKQIRDALPTGARIGKGVYTTLNNTFNDQLETILKYAYHLAQQEHKKTLTGTYIKKAINEYQKMGGLELLDAIETNLKNKIQEIRKTENEKRAVLNG